MATAQEVLPWLARKGVQATAEGRTTIHVGEFTVELPSNYKGIRASDLANFVVKRLQLLQSGATTQATPEVALEPAPEPEPQPEPEEPSVIQSSTEDSDEEAGNPELEADEPEQDFPTPEAEELEQLSHKELNVLLEAQGLSTNGSKADKITRLQG